MNEPLLDLNEDQEAYFRFFTEVGIINQLSSTRAERIMPHGLTMSQYGVLNHFVRGLPPKSPLGLANAFQVTKAAMTNTLKQLEKKGFVSIVPHETDGRSKIVSITPAGAAAHREALLELAFEFVDFRNAFTSSEIAELLPMLERIRIWLDEHRR